MREGDKEYFHEFYDGDVKKLLKKEKADIEFSYDGDNSAYICTVLAFSMHVFL